MSAANNFVTNSLHCPFLNRGTSQILSAAYPDLHHSVDRWNQPGTLTRHAKFLNQASGAKHVPSEWPNPIFLEMSTISRMSLHLQDAFTAFQSFVQSVRPAPGLQMQTALVQVERHCRSIGIICKSVTQESHTAVRNVHERYKSTAPNFKTLPNKVVDKKRWVKWAVDNAGKFQ